LSCTVLLLFIHISGWTGFAQTRLTPSALSFGSQVINQPSAALGATIENTQSVPLSIGGIAISGGNASSDYVAAGNCPLSPGTLDPGAECRITVTFTPSALGLRTATLTVTDDAHTTVARIALTGTGAAPVDGIPANGNFAGTSATSLATLSSLPTAAGSSSDDTASDKSGHGGPVIPGAKAGSSNSPILSPVVGPISSTSGLLSITVTPVNLTLGMGKTQQFTATGHYAGGKTANVTASVMWTSSAPGVATISAAGQASTIAPGSTTITAVYQPMTTSGSATGVAPGKPIGSPIEAMSGSTVLTVATGFVLTGGLNTARYYHTATMLNNGQVLIAGGDGGVWPTLNPLTSAELYNPATGTFTSTTGSMNTARYYHTATLLNNGLVLIVGGYGDMGYLVDAELYNPATGTFATTGSLNVARAYHAATLLNNGQVLITGGYGWNGGGSQALTSAELYNPATGTFSTTTGPMSSARAWHNSTLLNNGQVLIVGGYNYNSSSYPAAGELYNPANETFTPTFGNMNTPRSNQTATLLNNGMVLIAAGYNSGLSSPYLATAELYNPVNETFSYTIGNLTVARQFPSATLLNNGQVLIAGGYNASGDLTDAELYNSASGAFSATGVLNTARIYHTATLLNNGRLLMAGGAASNGVPIASAELYEPSSLTPSTLLTIAVSPSNPTLSVGNTQLFTATGAFSNSGTQQLASVTWSSSNTNVLTISNDASDPGAAVALAQGSATVSACAGTVCGSTLVTVQPTAPNAQLNYGSLSFGSQIENNTSAAQSVILTNTGNSSLSIASISLTGTNASDFAITVDTCPGTLLGGSNCTVSVKFTPQATGPRSATLVFTDNSNNVGGSQQSVNLSGTGLAPLVINNPGLPSATVGVLYSNYLNASGGSGGYTWSYSVGSGQSFPGCLVLTPNNGLMVGTPVSTCVGSYTFNVTVTDSASNQSTGTFSITINAAATTVCESGNESILSGQYAFIMMGYRPGNTFQARVGAFTANGSGHITGGEYDRNYSGGSSTTFVLTGGTYTVGADYRGCATFTTSSGNFVTRFSLGATSGGTATQGRIIEFDAASSNELIATGQLFQQTTSTTPGTNNFTGALSGGYAHLWTGWDQSGSGGRIACDGVKTYGSGAMSAGELYCNDRGNAPTNPSTGFTGSYTAIDSWGRYTWSFGPINLVGYLTSATASGAAELTTSVQGSNSTILAGQEYAQTGGPYKSSSMSSSVDAVYYVNGLSSSTSGKIAFGLGSSDGTNLTLNPYYENDGGVWNTNVTSLSCPYTVAGNGGLSGCGGMMYLYGTDTAVVVGNDGGISAGYVLPQTGSGSFTPAGLAGTFFGATSEIVNLNAESQDAVLTLVAGTGSALSGSSVSDEYALNYQQPDDAETFSGLSLDSSGTISSSKHGTTQVGGVAIDDTHFLTVSNTGCSGSGCYPTISLYGPSVGDSVAITVNSSTSSSSSVAVGNTLPLTVAVNPPGSNTGVTWTINGLTNTTTDYGSITGSYPNFTYSPPGRVPDVATFNLMAISNADVSKSASVTVTILAGAGPAPLSIVTTSLPSGTLNSGYARNILTNGGTLPLTWSVISGSLPSGVTLAYAGNGLGEISGAPRGTYGTFNFTVQATDSSTTPQTATKALSIVVNPPTVNINTTSLPNGVVGSPYNQTLFAGGGTFPYTWSITNGSLPGGLSLNSSNGQITGTPTTVQTANFTVQVADSSLPTAVTASQPLSITINSNQALPCADSGSEGLLNGQYAFNLTGYTSSGYLSVVGSFTADGHGAITAGEADTNGVLGVQNSGIDTTHSSYSVGSNNMGCATIVTSFGTFNARLALGTIAVQNSANVATAGRMMEWDAPSSMTYFAGTGQLIQQNLTGGLSGTYVFGESGVDANNSGMAQAGLISVGSSSTLTGGIFDLNDAGNMETGTGGTGAYSSVDSNGRISFSTTWAGSPASYPAQAYMVSTSQLLFVTTSPASSNGVMTGQMIQQNAPGGGFVNGSMDGNVVFYQTEMNSGSSGEVQIGILGFDGVNSFSLTSYDDSAGTIETDTGSCSSYTVGANGRMTIGSTCGNHPPIFYLSAANTGFMLGTDSGVAYGQFFGQTGGPFSSSSVSGTVYMGELDVVSQAVNTGVGVVTLNSSGGVSGVADYTATSGQTADETFTGTITVNSNGTFNPAGTISGIFISNTEFVAIDFASNTYPILNWGKQ
jgi:hypothetical protein